jgi:hypothetical protein
MGQQTRMAGSTPGAPHEYATIPEGRIIIKIIQKHLAIIYL